MSPPTWHADDKLVRLQTPRASSVVALPLPAQGVHEWRIDTAPLEGLELLQVVLPEVDPTAPAGAIESFVRDGDLAVTYADRPRPHMRAQIYWRASAHQRAGAVAALELLVSVQTDSLDSRPQITVGSRLPAQEVFRSDDPPRGTFVEAVDGALPKRAMADHHPCAHLVHLPGGQFSYAQMVHPADSHKTWLESASDGSLRLGHELFSQRLEKGVILRARVLGVLLERADDRAAAAEHFAAFLSEQLPLTT